MSLIAGRNQSRISVEIRILCNAHSPSLNSLSSSLTRAHCVSQRQDSLLVVTCSAFPFLAVLSRLSLSLAMLLAKVCLDEKEKSRTVQLLADQGQRCLLQPFLPPLFPFVQPQLKGFIIKRCLKCLIAPDVPCLAVIIRACASARMPK